jgi:hypothetical protein
VWPAGVDQRAFQRPRSTADEEGPWSLPTVLEGPGRCGRLAEAVGRIRRDARLSPRPGAMTQRAPHRTRARAAFHSKNIAGPVTALSMGSVKAPRCILSQATGGVDCYAIRERGPAANSQVLGGESTPSSPKRSASCWPNSRTPRRRSMHPHDPRHFRLTALPNPRHRPEDGQPPPKMLKMSTPGVWTPSGS